MRLSDIPSCFVTGTGTGVGKTWFTVQLLTALRSSGIDAVGFKPIVCGDDSDAVALAAASDHVIPVEEINPVWLRTPASPFTACQVEGRTVDIPFILEKFTALQSRFPRVIVEGAGGWRVPIRRDYFISDLAAEFALPILLVIHNKLGALNEALLTIEAIRRDGLPFLGYHLNEITPPTDIAEITNAAILEDILGPGLSIPSPTK